MRINVKMPTIVGTLTFMSMINTSLDSLKARKVVNFQHFCFYEQLKFYAHVREGLWQNMKIGRVEHEKVYNLRARSYNISFLNQS